MSKVGEFYRELAERRLKARVSPMFEEIEGPQHPDEMRPDEDPVSNCCSAHFTYPGWPDSDMCSKCFEHADIGDDDD